MIEAALRSSLDRNLMAIEGKLSASEDFKTVHLTLACTGRAVLCYMEGLVDTRMMQEGIVGPLQAWKQELPSDLNSFAGMALQIPGRSFTADRDEALELLLRGMALLLIDRLEGALLLSTQGGESRAPDEPVDEPTLRGPHDGFTEPIAVNRSLIRRRLIDPNLTFELLTIGAISKTKVNIVYIKGLVPNELLNEVRGRLGQIRTAGLQDSSMVAEWIEDTPLSPFPQLNQTSRPDRVAASLLEGRVAILVDQAPTALIAPVLFWDFLQASDDYYERWWAASAIRLLRSFAVLLSLTLPGLWVLLLSFHQELLPTPLALSVAAGRERVPFPTLLETLTMEVVFEILREAGVRLPKPVGQTIGIVGALVIGQSAVQAGLVSPANVIVVALTGLASFVTPSFSAAFSFRLLRFAVLIASGTFGLLGFGYVLMILTLHLIHLKSFGVHYLSPALPYMPGRARELVIRPSMRWLKSPKKRWWLP